ncbi:hypothetical protein EV182_004925 [Spiromyces aspiralis]|uniref:Uncharacterized protein n=1 Tax=Spiromyces aspiralis TaxID=68401 RepID=A0ACC1HGY7_9FUNG|nr:hypothetical protein EV182_004925 [Spiromyces aspiralis]
MRDGSTELYTGGGDSEVLIWRPARLERISELQEKASTPAASGLAPPRLSTANRRGFPASPSMLSKALALLAVVPAATAAAPVDHCPLTEKWYNS